MPIIEGHRKMEARKAGKLEMHPEDATARGIADGDRVRVFNDRGELRLTALLNGQPARGRGGRAAGLGQVRS